MMLSPNFSLAEMTVTTTGLSNTPSPVHLTRLLHTARQMERVRALLGHPIRINSAYRSPAVNRAVGGVENSHHALGWAVDFVCPGFGSPYQVCRAIAQSDIEFDQLILERNRWTHISFAPQGRRGILTLPPKGEKYLPGILRLGGQG